MIQIKNIAGCLCLVCLMMLMSCAPGPNEFRHIASPSGHIAGFWMGLWQGIILPFSFIASWFTSGVNIYEVHNSGFWYNLGFFLGLGTLGGGTATASRK